MASSSMGPPTSVPDTIELARLPRNFSFADYLSDLAQPCQHRKILQNGNLLSPSHIIALGLTEVGYKKSEGFFLHLGLEYNKGYGHPCDILFMNKEWTPKATLNWETGNWAQRLRLIVLTENIPHLDDEEPMIPINARILNVSLTSDMNSTQDAELTLDSKRREPHSELGIMAPITYGRLPEDISTYLVHWPQRGCQPYVCEKIIADNDFVSTRVLVPEAPPDVFYRFNCPGFLDEMCYNVVRTRQNRKKKPETILAHDYSAQDVFATMRKAWSDASKEGTDTLTASTIVKWVEIRQAIGLDDTVLP